MSRPILLVHQEHASAAAKANPDYEVVSWPATANPSEVDWSRLEGREVAVSDLGIGQEKAQELAGIIRSVRSIRNVTEHNETSGCVSPSSGERKGGVRTTSDSVSLLVGQFIEQSEGIFTVSELCQATGLTSPQARNAVYQALLREKNKNKIARVSSRNGNYRRVESECQAIDFLAADCSPVSLALPFKLHELAEIMPGNIIVLAGEPNAGKTAFLLNAVRENMVNWQVHYFNSEMGASELRKRLSRFDTPLTSWKFHAWERTDNFQDAIRSGQGVLNVIDFLEIHDEFYRVAGQLAAIHAKLNGAVAIVALQKNRGTDLGRGGGMSLEKPRLYLAMEPGKIKIVKAKNFAGTENPNGMERRFKLVDGCKFYPQNDWSRPAEKAA